MEPSDDRVADCLRGILQGLLLEACLFHCNPRVLQGPALDGVPLTMSGRMVHPVLASNSPTFIGHVQQ